MIKNEKENNKSFDNTSKISSGYKSLIFQQLDPLHK